MLKRLLTFFVMAILSYSAVAFTIENNYIKDSQGNKIELKKYEKIIILDPAVVETLYMINGENSIAAIGKTARSRIYPEDKTEKLQNIGNITSINLEKILSFSPDLVILNPMAVNGVQGLSNLKIPYIINEANTINDILENIKIYGKIAGREKEAEELYNSSLEKLENIRNLTEKNPLNLKGTVLYSTSPMMAFNSKSLPGQILNLLGVENISDNLKGDKPIISSEFLLKENPNFLAGAMSIKSGEDILSSNPIVKETIAGKNKNVFVVDSSKILRSSPRIFEAIEEFYLELKNIKK